MSIANYDFSIFFSQILSFALLERGFASNSCEFATIGLRFIDRACGFLPHTHTGKSGGQVHPSHHFAIACFTILSSKEWKVITASLPPSHNRSNASSSPALRASNSWFTSIRSA